MKKPIGEKRGGELERMNQNPFRYFTPTPQEKRTLGSRKREKKRDIKTVWMDSFRPQRTCRVPQL